MFRLNSDTQLLSPRRRGQYLPSVEMLKVGRIKRLNISLGQRQPSGIYSRPIPLSVELKPNGKGCESERCQVTSSRM